MLHSAPVVRRSEWCRWLLIWGPQVLHSTATKLLGIQRPSFGDLNEIASRALASVLLPARWRAADPASPFAAAADPGRPVQLLGDVVSRLCPHPSLRLLSLYAVPQIPAKSVDFTTFTWPGMLKRLRQMAVTGAIRLLLFVPSPFSRHQGSMCPCASTDTLQMPATVAPDHLTPITPCRWVVSQASDWRKGWTGPCPSTDMTEHPSPQPAGRCGASPRGCGSTERCSPLRSPPAFFNTGMPTEHCAACGLLPRRARLFLCGVGLRAPHLAGCCGGGRESVPRAEHVRGLGG